MEKKIMALAMLMLAGVLLNAGCLGPGNSGVSNSFDAGNGDVSIPESDVADSAKFYQYNYGETAIRFFVVRGPDEKIHTAFDACDVCYREKKGYRQNGNYMQCNNCGQMFAINGIGTQNRGGGCWPGYLLFSLSNGNVIITESDLQSGLYYFQ